MLRKFAILNATDRWLLAMGFLVLWALTLGAILFTAMISSQENFEARSTQKLEHTIEELSAAKAVQTMLVNFHQLRSHIGSNELSAISQNLFKTYHFISQIGYAEWVSEDEREQLVTNMHDLGYISFNIPKHSPLAATVSPDYLAVTMIEPLTPSTAAFLGTDLLSFPQAADQARDAVIANQHRTILLPGKSSVQRFLMLLPVYYGVHSSSPKERLQQRKGISLLELDIAHIFEDIVEDWSVHVQATFIQNQQHWTLFESIPDDAPSGLSTITLKSTKSIDIGGGTVELSILEHRNILADFGVNFLVATLLVGFAVIALAVYIAERRHITRQKAIALREIQSHQHKAEVTLRSISDAVITLDTGGLIIYANQAAIELLASKNVGQVIGKPLEQLVALNTGDTNLITIDPSVLIGAQGITSQIGRLTNSLDQSHDVEFSVSPLIDASDERFGTVITISDLTKEMELRQELIWHADHDGLTGLFNRRATEARLNELIAAASADSSSIMFYMDLDEFKTINDTCGHHAGDQLLQLISSTLANFIRNHDMLSRLGGDEFSVLLPDCNLSTGKEIAARMQSAINNLVYIWEGTRHSIGVSIGIVKIDSSFHTLYEVLQAADLACYSAKEKGRGTIQVYSREDQQVIEMHSEMSWLPIIRDALEHGRFCLYHQLIFPVDSSKDLPILHEILIRLVSEDGKLISPGDFLGAAERYGLMTAIDLWVITTSLEWIKHHPEKDNIYSINISGQSLANDEFLKSVSNILDEFDVGNNKICFEITETAVISSHIKAQRFIAAIRKKGCLFALDDFGTGLSSFAYLKHFEVDYLKIDIQFIEQLAIDKVNHAMVKSIQMMANELNILTVAEGVIDEPTLEACRKLDITYLQGFAISTPMPLMTSPEQDASILSNRVSA